MVTSFLTCLIGVNIQAVQTHFFHSLVKIGYVPYLIVILKHIICVTNSMKNKILFGFDYD